MNIQKIYFRNTKNELPDNSKTEAGITFIHPDTGTLVFGMYDEEDEEFIDGDESTQNDLELSNYPDGIKWLYSNEFEFV